MNLVKGIKISLRSNYNNKNDEKKIRSSRKSSSSTHASNSNASVSISTSSSESRNRRLRSARAIPSSSVFSNISDVTTKSSLLESNDNDVGILENVLSVSCNFFTTTPNAVIALYQEGIENMSHNLYNKALEKLERALNLSIQMNNKNNADAVSDDVISCIRIEIGKVLYHFGQYKQSAMLFASSREIIVLLLNDNNYDDDGSYLNAIFHEVIAYGDNNAKEEEASSPSNNKSIISYYKEVINMGSMLLGTLHIDNAIVNQNVGDLYSDLDYFKEAVPYFKVALKAHLSSSSSSFNNNNKISPEISSLLFKIGRVYYETDQYKSALKYFNSSLSMDQHLYGSTHHSLAHTYLLIGQTHLNTSRLEESIANLSKALSLLSFTDPSHHTDISSILLRIGIAYTRQQDYASAEQVCLQRLSLQKTIYASNTVNIHIAGAYKQLATICMSRKHFEKALHAYLQLLNLQRKLLGKEHYDVALLLIHIGGIYQYDLYALPSAITVYQEALRILQLHNNTDKDNYQKKEEHKNRMCSLQNKITTILLTSTDTSCNSIDVDDDDVR